MLLVAAVAAFALIASQQGGDGGGSGPLQPLNAIAAAAERTQGEPGGRVAMHAIVESPSESKPLVMTGHTVYSGNRTQGLLRFANPDTGKPAEMELAAEGTHMYMRSDLFKSLPGGKEWMGLDLSVVPTGEAPVPTNVDAKGELAVLEAVTGGVQKLGREEVRGVSTTRYRGEVDNVKRAKELEDEGADKLAEIIEDGAPTKVEAWIDPRGLIRRMRIVTSVPGAEDDGLTTTDMQIDLFDFGAQPEIELPDSDEVFDMTAALESGIGLSD